MLNNGGKPKYTRCGRDNHTVDRCVARRSADGTVLHMMGNIEEVEYEVCVQPDEPNSHCGKFETFDYYCGNELEELMFLQPHVSSPVGKPNMSSKGEIAESWILLDSQSTIDVFSNPDLLVNIHKATHG